MIPADAISSRGTQHHLRHSLRLLDLPVEAEEGLTSPFVPDPGEHHLQATWADE